MPLIARLHVAPALAVAVLALCPTLSAQTVRGTIVDSETSTPVPQATVELLRDGQRVARDQSNQRGEFQLRARSDGQYIVQVRRIGFKAFDSVVTVAGDMALALVVAPNPVELATLGVTADMYPYLKTSGFLDRMAVGVGTFIDPARVELKAPKAKFAVDIMEGIPGVRIAVPSTSGGVRVPHLRNCQGDPRRRVATITGLVDTTELGNTYPGIYVDGAKVGQDVFGWLLPNQILAIEIYMGPAQIPLQYGGTGAPCGVILIWTKR